MDRHSFALVAVALLLAAAPLHAQVCEEEVVFDTSPGRIDIAHRQAEYNCCSWIEFEIVHVAFDIDIYEREQLEGGGCDCYCCFDLAIALGGLTPGVYVVRIWKNGELTGGVDVLLGEWTVPVEGDSPQLLRTAYIPCAGSTGAPEIDSWGMIKALYGRGQEVAP